MHMSPSTDQLILVSKEQHIPFQFDPPTVLVGRSMDADLRFENSPNHLRLSRKHALFLFEKGKWHIRDLGSTNGTYLNYQRLTPGTLYPLTSGDAVTFSNTQTVIFQPVTPPPKGTPLSSDHIQALQNAINATYPGLAMFVRDVNLPDFMANQYLPGMIIREKGFTDASFRVMGMVTSHRYAILSNHMANLSHMEQGTNWGLCVAKAGARFKVLGCHTYQGKTVIFLLHLPDDDRWKLFQNTVINSDEPLVQTCIQRFEQKCLLPPIPELATQQWLDRCAAPLGMSDSGVLFPLE